MPSHIFTRVGAWADSAATNRRSADAAQKSNEPDEALHALDYMTYAYLQLARDGDARKTFDEARTVTGLNPAARPGPTRSRRCRRATRSSAATGARRRSSTPSPSKYPYTEAMTHFARALGAARSGDPAAAQKDIERIVALRDRAEGGEERVLGERGRGDAARVARLGRARAEEERTRRSRLMRQAADIEDRSEKNIVTPGRLLPARELLGDMLLELKRPAEALKEYEASQLREPNRYRGLYGAGQAAAQSGNRDKARHYFSKLIELAGSGDLRPEMEKARRYLASN